MTLRLPVPPSVNSLYANVPGVGRITSRRYKQWQKEAGWQILIQKPPRVYGPYQLTITLPRLLRGDVTNRIKAAEDILVKHRVTDDDRFAEGVTIKRGDVTEMEIEIETASARKTA
ncbi:MAG: RusA family crossover junction endodeoxyribonuclease [Patescibacteria group bacterium]|nr:RusA family crossover junction endodeoxyribonuclease [Patescibacteria group bacterium]